MNPGLVPLLALGALLAAGALIHREKMGWAFTMTTLTILFTVATLFVSLYPRVMVSSLNPEWSLTIYNASSTPYTLKVMSIVAGIFVPVVLAYQAWTYWVFRHRITAELRDVLGLPAPDHRGNEARVLIPLPGAGVHPDHPSEGEVASRPRPHSSLRGSSPASSSSFRRGS